MNRLAFIVLLFMSCTSTETLYIGTYTNPNNKSEGVYVNTFNNKTGEIELLGHTNKLASPSYMAISHNGKYLYCVSEANPGKVSSFSVGKKGLLTPINSQSIQGEGPCHIAIDATDKWAVVSNYSSGNLNVFRVNDNGSLGELTQVVNHTKNNKQAHAHQATFAHNNNKLYAVDLGIDTLFQYNFDAAAQQPISQGNAAGVPEGSGPIHIAISNNEKFVYLLNEWAANVTVFEAGSNELQNVQVISTNAVDAPGGNKGSAAIRISPDGKHLYATNRGNTNTISTFSINSSGLLAHVEDLPVDKHPRDFNISPNGKWVLVAARDNNSVKVYKRDEASGKLTIFGKEVNFPSPVAVLFK